MDTSGNMKNVLSDGWSAQDTLITKRSFCQDTYRLQTLRRSWAGSGWAGALFPEPSACSPRSGEAVVCNTPPLPSGPPLRTDDSPWCWVCLSPTLHIKYLHTQTHRAAILLDPTTKWRSSTQGVKKTCIPRSISVKPSAFIASAVLLSIVSKQRVASWGSSNNLACEIEQNIQITAIHFVKGWLQQLNNAHTFEFYQCVKLIQNHASDEIWWIKWSIVISLEMHQSGTSWPISSLSCHLPPILEWDMRKNELQVFWEIILQTYLFLSLTFKYLSFIRHFSYALRREKNASRICTFFN